MAKNETVNLTLKFDAEGLRTAIAEFAAAIKPVALEMAKAEKAFAEAVDRALQQEGYVD